MDIVKEYELANLKGIYLPPSHMQIAIDEITSLRQQLAQQPSVDVLVEALRRFVNDAINIDLGGGDVVATSCESLEIATSALSAYELNLLTKV